MRRYAEDYTELWRGVGTFAKWGRIFESSQYTVYIAGNFREW